jgi:hypothetical protein
MSTERRPPTHSSSAAVRKGQGDVKLSREEFAGRLAERFYDPAFDAVRAEIDRIIEMPGNYDEYHKGPRERKASASQGSLFASSNCDGVTPWEVEVVADNGRFAPGTAEVTASALFTANGTTEERHGQASPTTVRLRANYKATSRKQKAPLLTEGGPESDAVRSCPGRSISSQHQVRKLLASRWAGGSPERLHGQGRPEYGTPALRHPGRKHR